MASEHVATAMGIYDAFGRGDLQAFLTSVGTFQAHLKDYPISAQTPITINITMPNTD